MTETEELLEIDALLRNLLPIEVGKQTGLHVVVHYEIVAHAEQLINDVATHLVLEGLLAHLVASVIGKYQEKNHKQYSS
jgi:hypothetical protein